MEPFEVKDKKWMLDNGHEYCHVLTKVGYRKVHVETGLYVCSSCDDLLNQESQAPYSALCACCNFSKNATKVLEQVRKLSLV